MNKGSRANILICENCKHKNKFFRIEETKLFVYAQCSKCGNCIKKWRL